MLYEYRHCYRSLLGSLAALIVMPLAAIPQIASATHPQSLVGSIAGKVLDETGKPTQGSVTIATKGQQLRTNTLVDGSFRFPDLPTGTYVLCAQPATALLKPTDRPLVNSARGRTKRLS